MHSYQNKFNSSLQRGTSVSAPSHYYRTVPMLF